jgi:biopolymer transport protein ExbD
VATTLPHSDQPLQPPREVCNLSIDFDGTLAWNGSPVDRPTMQGYISQEALKDPQPEVHITVNKFAKFEFVAQALADLMQRELPVIIEQVQLVRPKADNLPTQIKPEYITIAIDRQGGIYWNAELLTNQNDLLPHLRGIARQNPQPEVHIRGDAVARYMYVGQVLVATKMIGIRKVTASLYPTILVQKLMREQVH